MSSSAEQLDDFEAEIARKSRNFQWWCNQADVHITDKEGNHVKFVMNEAQQLIHHWRREIERSGELFRGIILKGRQVGCSTYFALDQLHDASTQLNRRCFMMLQDLDASKELFEQTIEYAYDHLDPYFKPTRKGQNVGRRLKFDNGSRLFVDSAKKGGAGRSGKIHKFHGTEMPDWPDADTTITGILPAIPKIMGTSAVFESTAQGMGDWFHRNWKRNTDRLKQGRGPALYPLFISWCILSEYERDPKPGELRREPISPEEEDVARRIEAELSRLKLPFNRKRIIRKLMFRRDEIERQDGKVANFNQEFPTIASEAFLLSGRPFYLPRNVARHLDRRDTRGRNVVSEPIARYEVQKYDEEVVYSAGGKPRIVNHYRLDERDDGRLKVWLPPGALDEPCVVGGDIATEEGDDHSAAQVLAVDGHKLDQVAVWWGDISPTEFAYVMAVLGKWYGKALLAPELNNHGGQTVTTLRQDIRYPRVYKDKRLDVDNGHESTIYGFPTNQRTRPAMLEQSADYIRTFDITLRDEETLNEALQLSIRKGKPQAPSGGHDDLLIALCIAIYCRNLVKRRKVGTTVVQSMAY